MALVSIPYQKSFARVSKRIESPAAMKRRVPSLALFVAFAFAIALSASPQLHERFHPGASQSQHECAVTLIAAGNYHHAAPPPTLTGPAIANSFSKILTLNPAWVPSPFLGARIFEHAPPENS